MKYFVLTLIFMFAVTVSAEVPAFDGEFTLKSGPYEVGITGKYKYCISFIKYGGFLIGNRKGFYGTILATASAKFIGAGHREGGVEKVESVDVLVDGKTVKLKAGAVLSGKKIEFRKVSIEDQLRVFVTMILDGKTIRIDKHFEALGPQKIYSFYIFQYCWSEKTAEWIAGRPDGSTVSGKFKSDKGWHLRRERELNWYSVYAPGAETGIVGYFAEYFPGQGSYMLWDKGVYHKFYFSARLPKLAPKGYKSKNYTMILKGFNVKPDGWKKDAERLAAGLRKEFPPPPPPSNFKWDFEKGGPGTVENEPFKGNRCLEIKGNGRFVCKKFPLPLERNQKYDISFAVRKGRDTSEKPSSNYVLAGQYDKQRKFHSFATFAENVPRDGQWHQVKGSFKAPETIHDCNLYIYNKRSKDSIWLDDIIISKQK